MPAGDDAGIYQYHSESDDGNGSFIIHNDPIDNKFAPKLSKLMT